MEKQGLVKRLKGGRKKNQVRVCLTEKGEKAFLDAAARESIKRIMSRLSEENRANLLEALLELRRSTLAEFLKDSRTPFPTDLIANLEKTSAPL
jgi:DNA-binding MarR family transcriptional regulator